MYPTEKNADMLDLIVKTSSNEDSIVLDCFCGSGTTLLAAQKNNRYWIGIDESDLAIQITTKKLDSVEIDLFYAESSYEFIDLHTQGQTIQTLQKISTLKSPSSRLTSP